MRSTIRGAFSDPIPNPPRAPFDENLMLCQTPLDNPSTRVVCLSRRPRTVARSVSSTSPIVVSCRMGWDPTLAADIA